MVPLRGLPLPAPGLTPSARLRQLWCLSYSGLLVDCGRHSGDDGGDDDNGAAVAG